MFVSKRKYKRLEESLDVAITQRDVMKARLEQAAKDIEPLTEEIKRLRADQDKLIKNLRQQAKADMVLRALEVLGELFTGGQKAEDNIKNLVGSIAADQAEAGRLQEMQKDLMRATMKNPYGGFLGALGGAWPTK